MNQVRAINFLNIAFMQLAAVLAIQLPFELFLFSYAVLGPLHYLTELNWLHKRDYFIPNSNWGWLTRTLILGALLGLVCSTILIVYFLTPYLKDLPNIPWTDILGYLMAVNNWYLYVVFALAASFALFIRNLQVLLASVIALVLGVVFYVFQTHPFIIIFTLLLPTILHVWLFTGLFIVAGALKGASKSAILSLVVFVGCSVVFFCIDFNTYTYKPSAYIRESFIQSNFSILNTTLYAILTNSDTISTFKLTSKIGLQIQAFIAFAYTYHYLNWFSKTTIIKWHQTPVWRLTIVGLLWLGSVALYALSYRIGLVCLYFLSVLHVIAEFPLNWVVLKEIGVAITKQFKAPIT